MSIATRFAVVASFLVVVSACIIGAILFGTNSEILLSRAKAELRFDLKQAGQILRDSVDLSRGEVKFLASLPQVQELAEGGQGPEERSRLVSELTEIFYSMAQSSEDLFQVRLIGVEDNAREIVRINRTANLVNRIRGVDLQQKANRSYVIETLRSAPGAILVSDIELNREEGEIQMPPVAVMRVSTPVYARGGRIFGLVVINLNMNAVFARMEQRIRDTANFYLVNSHGDFVVHPEAEKAFGFEYGRPYRLTNEFQELAGFVAQGETEQSLIVDGGYDGREVVMAIKESVFATQSQIDFVVAAALPTRAIYGDGMDTEISIVALTVLLAGLGAVIAIVTSRRLVGPLHHLSMAAARIAKGDSVDKLRLPEERDDELGILARSFKSMARALDERKETLEENEERIRAILEAAGTPILTIDRKGVITSANPATMALFGYDRYELIGNSVTKLMNAHDRDHHNQYLENFQRTGKGKVVGIGREVEARAKDGTPIPIHLSVSVVTLRSGELYTGVMTDLREQKKIARLKDEFVSTVSHELRTPLTSIKGSLALLTTSMFGALPKQALQMIEIAHNNSERLTRLVDDILDIEKIEAGKMSFHFSEVGLERFLDQMVEANAGYAQSAGVTLSVSSCPSDVMIEMDPDRLAQVVTNLVSNAIKFTPSGGEVTIGARIRKGRIRIAILDQGPGIPEEFHDKLFTKFAQADASTTRTRGGTGLGLAISKAIVAAHGGEIGFKSVKDQGSTFFVELPQTQPRLSDTKRGQETQVAGAA